MAFSKEFKHHLHELMVEASLSVRDETEQFKRQLVTEATKKNNGAALLSAYSRAAIHAFRLRTERIIASYLDAIDQCAMRVDDEVEKELLGLISVLTTATHPLQLSPVYKSADTSALERSYKMERQRTGNELYRSAANRLRALKLR